VTQESVLFPMTVAENIAFGRPDATRDEIVAAAAAAQADAFVRRLPQGYDTMVGERGATLSGGERQRIAIARALLKDAPILVLDEPTASLDARTEASLFDALSRLMRGRTTFVVSHRLATIRHADQIIALEHGRVAEHGTHDRLLARGDVYARLYRHQEAAALRRAAERA
jgi:ABC-type multidrug transport system fused ATPase/permease subunit